MDVFYALADQRRRRIMELIAARGQLPASEISRKFDITAQAISQHLRILREARLVKVQKNAQQRIYSINTVNVMEVEKWARETAEMWETRFQALDKVLAEESKRHAKK